MDQDEQRIDALLRPFRPRAPRPLPQAGVGIGPGPSPGRRGATTVSAWVAVAAAAAVAVVTANLRFMPMVERMPEIVIGPALTLNDMRGLVEADAATLDRALLEASRHVLPDVEAPDTVLGRLAQP